MEKQLGTYMQPQRLPGGIRTAVWSTKTGETINPLLNHDPQARGDYRGKEHPTQKPVPVIAWCIQQAPKAITVLDPFMGSGTTGVACALMLRAFTGIERERKYFDIACERISRAQAQGQLLPPEPPRECVQDGLL